MSETRTALITGGGSGIGAAMARRLAARGVRVAILGRTREKLEAVAASVIEDGNDEPLILPADQADEAEVNEAVGRTFEAFGSIDFLFNNAAVYEPGTTCDATLESWDRALSINVRGPVLLCRAVVPVQRRQNFGVIVNNSSSLGIKPLGGYSAYSMSKAALLALTRCLALEEAANGIRVLAICPGVVDTPIHGSPEESREFLEKIAKFHPLGRNGTADEVARLVEYLASDDASWMTGSVISIDGGIALT